MNCFTKEDILTCTHVFLVINKSLLALLVDIISYNSLTYGFVYYFRDISVK